MGYLIAFVAGIAVLWAYQNKDVIVAKFAELKARFSKPKE